MDLNFDKPWDVSKAHGPGHAWTNSVAFYQDLSQTQSLSPWVQHAAHFTDEVTEA